MEPETRYTAIGAVLLVLVLALLATMVWLKRNGRGDEHHYTVYFEHQSLEGLQVGSPVEMRGIPVGRVERLTISRDNINRIQVTLRVEAKTPVSVNTVAAVERKILTGLARVALDTPGTPGLELTEVPRGETFPVIAEGESKLEHVSDALNRLAINGNGALVGVSELLNEQNRKELMATVESIHRTSRAIEVAAGDLAQSGRQLAATAQGASAAAKPAADQATATLRDISRTAQAFEHTAQAVERTAQTLEHEVRATAQEMRSSAEVVSRAADRLDDPRALVFGPNPNQLGPGEKLR
jgi:phospholipid/cholesterol/gamma-HCH transport system substrate-binding protein